MRVMLCLQGNFMSETPAGMHFSLVDHTGLGAPVITDWNSSDNALHKEAIAVGPLWINEPPSEEYAVATREGVPTTPCCCLHARAGTRVAAFSLTR